MMIAIVIVMKLQIQSIPKNIKGNVRLYRAVLLVNKIITMIKLMMIRNNGNDDQFQMIESGLVIDCLLIVLSRWHDTANSYLVDI